MTLAIRVFGIAIYFQKYAGVVIFVQNAKQHHGRGECTFTVLFIVIKDKQLANT
jgi:hypothetical protein